MIAPDHIDTDTIDAEVWTCRACNASQTVNLDDDDPVQVILWARFHNRPGTKTVCEPSTRSRVRRATPRRP